MRGSLPYTLGLGLVPTGKRTVTPVPASLLALVPKPTGKNENIKSASADPLKDTVPLIQKMVRRQLWQGKKLAAALMGKSVDETVRNDWDFIFNHIQYVPDPAGKEQVRSLRRLVHDGRGDCDCYVSGLSNLLLNQGIHHKLRVAKYAGGSNSGLLGTWQHIYIVVPHKGSYITLDPVVHKFNHEVPFSDKKDFDMRLEYLDGFDGACETATAPKKWLVIPAKQLADAGLVKTDDVLSTAGVPFQQKMIGNEPAFVVSTPNGEVTLSQFIPEAKAEQLAAALKATANDIKAELTDGSLSKSEKIVGGTLLGFLALLLLAKALKKKKKTAGLSGAKPSNKLDTLKI